jgi:hypothetical protein
VDYEYGTRVVPYAQRIKSIMFFFLPGVPPVACAVAAVAPKEGAATTPRTVASIDDDSNNNSDEESGHDATPWEDHDWVPMTTGGKQKTPNQIRNEFQKYLDQCGRTQTAVLAEIGINNNSFRRFMNPKTYKGKWSGTENGTYWAAARLLAKHNHEEKKQKEADRKNKRKGANGEAASAPATKKAKTTGASRAGAEAWMLEVVATPGANTEVVYDSCPELIQKIKTCLNDTPGLTKAAFCKIALEGSNSNALVRFLAAKKQDQQGNAVYRKAYAFFEKLRIKNGETKSKSRLRNEVEKGLDGFETCPNRDHFKSYILARF